MGLLYGWQGTVAGALVPIRDYRAGDQQRSGVSAGWPRRDYLYFYVYNGNWGCVIGLITSANVGFRLCAFPWRGSGLPNRAVSARPPKSGIKQSILKDPITRRLKGLFIACSESIEYLRNYYNVLLTDNTYTTNRFELSSRRSPWLRWLMPRENTRRPSQRLPEESPPANSGRCTRRRPRYTGNQARAWWRLHPGSFLASVGRWCPGDAPWGCL